MSEFDWYSNVDAEYLRAAQEAQRAANPFGSGINFDSLGDWVEYLRSKKPGHGWKDPSR